MALFFVCDVCDERIGDAQEMGDNSTVIIQTSAGPLSVVMSYGFGIMQNETFRPNTRAVCKRCVLLNLQAELDKH